MEELTYQEQIDQKLDELKAKSKELAFGVVGHAMTALIGTVSLSNMGFTVGFWPAFGMVCVIRYLLRPHGSRNETSVASD